MEENLVRYVLFDLESRDINGIMRNKPAFGETWFEIPYTEALEFIEGRKNTANYTVIKDVEKNISSLMIVGHNPSMHEFSESFSGQFIEKFSTCGLASFEFDDEWINACENFGTLIEFKIPSELR